MMVESKAVRHPERYQFHDSRLPIKRTRSYQGYNHSLGYFGRKSIKLTYITAKIKGDYLSYSIIRFFRGKGSNNQSVYLFAVNHTVCCQIHRLTFSMKH